MYITFLGCFRNVCPVRERKLKIVAEKVLKR
jgi:hypothetical protein